MTLFVGHDPVAAVAAIEYITPVVDPHTRTATARATLTNPEGFWRPGMFVTARVEVENVDVAVSVPHSAVHTLDEGPVVFVATHAGFEPRPIALGRRGAQRVEVLEGISAGTPVVVEGGFTIKAELGKHAFGDGHAH